MTYKAVAYISSAISGLATDQLDHLLVDARAHNQIAGVTGVLLYDGRRFFQYFEGPTESVERIYSRIRSSVLHHDLVELHHYPIEFPYFTQWNMGCKEVEDSVLQKISTQQRMREADHLQEVDGEIGSPALHDLVEFWSQIQTDVTPT